MRSTLALTLLISATTACEWGWEEHKDKCYKLQRERMSWTMHNFDCVYSGGALASITSYEENEIIRRVAGGQDVYIGGASFGWEWAWSDGSSFYSYQNWDDQSDSVPPMGKPCMKLMANGKWQAHCCAHPPSYAVCVRKW